MRHPVLGKAQFFQGKSETKMIYIRQLRSFLMNGVCFSTHTRDTYWRKWVLSFDFQLGRLMQVGYSYEKRKVFTDSLEIVCNFQWLLISRHCGIAVGLHRFFALYFDFGSVYCFALIFSFAYTRSVDNVSSLHNTFYTKVNIRHLLAFVWEALQMIKNLELWVVATPVSLQKRKGKVGHVNQADKHIQPGTVSL